MTPGVCTAAFQLHVPLHILVQGLVPPQMQGFALVLFTQRDIPVSPFHQPVQVLLVGSTILSPYLCATCQLSEGTLCPSIQPTEWEQDPQNAAQDITDVCFDVT